MVAVHAAAVMCDLNGVRDTPDGYCSPYSIHRPFDGGTVWRTQAVGLRNQHGRAIARPCHPCL